MRRQLKVYPHGNAVKENRQQVNGVNPQACAVSPEQQRIQALEAQTKPLKHNNDSFKKTS